MKRLVLLLLLAPNLLVASIGEVKQLLNNGEPDQALQVLLKMKQTLDVSKWIGNCYAYSGNLSKAKSAYNDLLVKAKQEGDIQYQAFAYNNLANIEFDYSNFQNSSYLYERAINLKYALNDPSVVRSITGLSTCYFELGDIEKARDTQLKVFQFEIKDSLELSKIYNNLGRYYYELKIDSALYYSKIALQVAISPYDEMYAHENRAKYFERLNSDSTIYHYKKYVQLKDELFDLELQQRIAEIEEAHQATIEQMEEEHQELIAWITGSFSGGFMLILLFAAANKMFGGFKLPRLALPERLKNRLPEEAKLVSVDYQKAMPEPIETKTYEVIDEIIRKSGSERVFLTIASDGKRLEVVLNISHTTISDIEMIPIKLKSEASSMRLTYQAIGGKLHCFLEWPSETRNDFIKKYY